MTAMTVDTVSEERKRANIYQAAYEGTKTAIESEIENEKEKTRNGHNGFWSQIFFAIAEFIDGLFNTNFCTGMLAKMNGTPIPEKSEIEKASEQVGKAVSDKLNDKDFKFEDKKAFEAGIKEAIHKNLTDNHAAFPSFSEEQIEKMATEGAQTAGKKCAGFFDKTGKAISGSTELSPVDAAAKTEMMSTLGHILETMPAADKNALATALGKKDIEAADYEGVANVLAPTIVSIQSRAGELKKQGGQAFASVADELRARLVENRAYINDVGQLNLSDATLGMLADGMAVNMVAGPSIGVNPSDMPKEFIAAAEGRNQAFISDVARKTISEKVSEEIKVGTAKTVMATYNDAIFFKGSYPEKDIAVMNGCYSHDGKGEKAENYHLKTDLTPRQIADLQRAQQNIYELLKDTGRTLNDNQRQLTSDKVAEIVVGVTNNRNASLSDQDEFAIILEKKISTGLKGSIKDKDKIFGDIATGFADAVREDKDGAFSSLSEMRAKIEDSRIRATGVPSGDGSNIGITDGQEHSGPNGRKELANLTQQGTGIHTPGG